MGDFLPDSDSISSSNLPKLKINCSPGLAGWLQTQGISLAFTTYQSNWLFFISCNQQGRIAASDRLFDKPMGMYAVNNSIYTSTRYQIWRFENLLTTKGNLSTKRSLCPPKAMHKFLTTSARSLFEQGKQSVQQGDLQRAIASFREAIRLQPDYIAAYNQLGNAFQGLGQMEQAIA